MIPLVEKLKINKNYKDLDTENTNKIINIISQLKPIHKGLGDIYSRLGNVLYIPNDDRLMTARSTIIDSLKKFSTGFACNYAANTTSPRELENNKLLKELVDFIFNEESIYSYLFKWELKFQSDPQSRKYNQQYVIITSDKFVLHFVGPNIFNKKQDKFVAPEKWGYFECIIGYNKD